MSLKLALLISISLVVACNDAKAPSPAAKQSPATATPPAAGDPCATVGEAVRAIWDRQVADAPDADTKRGAQLMGDKAVARLQKHCRDDHWTPEVIACVRGGSATCTNRMTPEQAQKLGGDKLD